MAVLSVFSQKKRLGPLGVKGCEIGKKFFGPKTNWCFKKFGRYFVASF